MLYIKDDSGNYCSADESDVIFEATSIYNSYFCKGTALTSPDESANAENPGNGALAK